MKGEREATFERQEKDLLGYGPTPSKFVHAAPYLFSLLSISKDRSLFQQVKSASHAP